MTLIKLLQFDKSIDIESFLNSNTIESVPVEKPVKKSIPTVKSAPKVQVDKYGRRKKKKK